VIDGRLTNVPAESELAIVSDPANGTPSLSIFDQIGAMPDLAEIITNEFI
jgi:hypothetical protein